MGNEVVVAQGRPRRTGIVWAVLVLLIIAAAVAYLFYVNRPRPAVVVRRDIVGKIVASGDIVVPPDARADVFAPFQAPVQRVIASVGQHVRRGDNLVKLSVPNLATYQAQTETTLKAAETAYKRAVQLYGAPSRQSTTATDATGATAGAVTTTDNSAQLAPYRQQLDAAEDAYRDAHSGSAAGYVRAPISGTVLALNAQPGATAGTDSKVPLATIVNLRALQVAAPLTAAQDAAVRRDMPVDITFANVPGETFRGRVTRITSQVVSRAAGLVKQSQYVALVDFKNSDEAVKPGMKPMVALLTGEAKDAVAVPSDAVQMGAGGRASVKVRQGTAWQSVPVVVGVSDGRYTQIRSGLQPGEVVQETPNVLNAASLPKP